MRCSLRATAAALMRLLGPEGIHGFTLHAIARLAADVSAVERFAGRWGVQGLAAELAEPAQLCALLLSNKLEDVLSPELRAQHYSALDPAAVAAALDRYREVPSQSKKQPAWPSKKAADAVARQLRGQMVAGAAGQRALEGL
ncbi:hypothetical protein MNEG_13740 [Monoraphidium neglectum]|uniref:Exocyst complex subunit EXOC6/Sec15 C-terminal domain-containing protein n=1 Tax=Monoraphidium neglectum TaxID=145388 RepID=A0A0D2KEJ0_9CHLO|nr:hypothetical protein MNEG_13740 [Monoraphidium neglectum]KIY94223.1 hypothetical protein MNEG_13740 [Monoraphidium neglectum]|eukprot:XP_013893243.1 hypothetical protein MNEG_13740 [Monoraphidium neglectum]